MSQTSTGVRTGGSVSGPVDDARVVADDDVAGLILDALEDDDCRAIMEATDEESLTAREVSEAVGLPKSTTYRKLDLLTETGILDEGTRLGCGGSHATEYTRVVADICVSVTAERGVVLTIAER